MIQFKNRQFMKAFTKFDYPTSQATTFKAYKQPQSPPLPRKQNYQQHLKQESQNQRDRVQVNQHKKQQQLNQQQQNKIRQEIERKRRELLQLEQLREEAIEQEQQAAQMARVKEEQDRVTRLQMEQKMRQNEVNAQGRFREALRRLQLEREQNNLSEKQAFIRRKVCQEVEKDQRDKAVQFQARYNAQLQQQRERAKEEQRKGDEAFRLGLGKFGVNKNIDYSKTCFHNPRMVYKHSDEDNEVNAIERGEAQEQRQQTMNRLKQEKQSEERRRSLERGQAATRKIQLAHELATYQNQTANQQVQYNMQRIQEGKRNQNTGLKPLTLQQIQMNKRLRAEGEFEGMFIGPQVQLQQHNRSAHNYTIVENRFSRATESQRQVNNTESSHSFAVYDPKSTFNPQNYAYSAGVADEEQESDLIPRQVVAEPIQSQLKRPMAETRAQDHFHRGGDLDYSESEEDESNY